MNRSAAPWALAGVVAGAAGVGTSYLTAEAMSLRLSPVGAVAELIARIAPGALVEKAISTVGTADKPLLVLGILVVLVLAYAGAGLLARRAWWVPVLAFAALATAGGVAMMTASGAVVTDLAPVVVGFVTQSLGLALAVDRLRRLTSLPDETDAVTAGRGRRDFLAAVGGVAAVGAVGAVLGKVAGRARDRVEQARRLLRLPVTPSTVPAGADLGVRGVSPWQTPNADFYLIDTTFTKPTIEPEQWRLRIHGLVENDIELTFEDLAARELTEAWITLNCVSNPVGGDLIGNAWWSGVRLASILAEAGPIEGADCVLQTSEDGWTCGTPLAALTDGRDAMLALAMNSKPLPIEHGFPVRTLVPGLYGYVSACKWVVDMEVTRFDRVSAYWTQRGWGERGPVKISSRVEVPGPGDEVGAGKVTVAGTAWYQHVGIAGVEVALDGGDWMAADLGGAPSDATWVQWRTVLEVGPGDHVVKVRATATDGAVQTGVRTGTVPDGATGWHRVEFSAA